MIIKYDITVTILNIINNSTSTFAKTFEKEINMVDALLYNNYHILSKDIYILDMFSILDKKVIYKCQNGYITQYVKKYKNKLVVHQTVIQHRKN